MMEKKFIKLDNLKIKRWLGLTLIALSFAFYGGLFLVPFTSLSAKNSVLLSSLLVICGEASFWIGVLILGKEAVSKYRNINWRSWAAKLFGPSKKNGPGEEEKKEL
jgi:hypothetical protein